MTLKELLAKNEAIRMERVKKECLVRHSDAPENFEEKPNNKRKGRKPANREYMVVDPELNFIVEEKKEEEQPEEVNEPVEEIIEEE